MVEHLDVQSQHLFIPLPSDFDGGGATMVFLNPVLSVLDVGSSACGSRGLPCLVQ